MAYATQFAGWRGGARKVMRTPSQIESLTGIRYCAAAAVVMYHFVPATDPLGWIFRDGWLGVPFFFALSGAVLAYSYLQPFLENGAVSHKRFLALRFARIYPCYLLAFVVAFGPFVESQLRAADSFESAVLRIVAGATMYLSLLQSWFTTPWTSGVVISPAWSLSCEWFFYVAFCPLLSAMRPILTAGATASRRAFLATCGLLTALTAAEYFLSAYFPTGIRDFWPDYFWRGAFGNFPYFLGGVFVGRLLHDASRPRNRLPEFWTFVGITGMLLLFCYPTDAIGSSLKRIAILPTSAAAIYGLACGKTRISRFLSRPVLGLLGEASYPLYLLQLPLDDVFSSSLPPHGVFGATMRLILFSAVSVLAAVYVERPARTLLKTLLLGQDRCVSKA